MVKFSLVLVGKKEVKSIYLRYRPNRDIDIKIKTPYSINSVFWDSVNECYNTALIVKGAKTAETKQRNAYIQKFNNILNAFRDRISEEIIQNLHLSNEDLKKHLSNFILVNYFGKEVAERKNKIPEKFTDLIDYYINFRSTEDKTQGKKALAESTKEKQQGIKKLIQRYNKDLKVTEINNIFRRDFTAYMNEVEGYAESTQIGYLKKIKTLCLFAKSEYVISPDVEHWSIKGFLEVENKTKGIFFTMEQIKALKRLDLSQSERLDNVRDWLLISVFTGVRVSELMNMKSEDITEDGRMIKVIEQKNRNKKGGGLKYIAIWDEVKTILKKRNGEFPKRISHQRYNDYIKEVCKVAGFDELITSAKTFNTDKGNRKVTGEYPFYDLITSHIGRQTFVTLFKDYIPSEILQMGTNHASTQMLMHYNKEDFDTQQKRKAETVLNAFNHLKIV